MALAANEGADGLIPSSHQEKHVTIAARHLGIRMLVRSLVCSSVLCGLVVIESASAFAQSDSSSSDARPGHRDGQHDFDFEFGAWKVRLSRLEHPLAGSKKWLDYEGTSVVRRVWDGRANLGEIRVDGPAGHIEGLSLRLYSPESRQWHIRWANVADGLMGEPMIGEFEDGRGEFYDQESLNGRAILVRFVFSDVSASAFKFEQAFSDDGGRTWEANWIATFTKVSDESEEGT